MPDKLIQISRQGVLLGTLRESEARELLAIGLLKPDDQFCSEELSGWKPLHELRLSAQSLVKDASWVQHAKQSLVSAKDSVASTAGGLAKKAREFAGSARAKATEAPEKLLSGFVPQIKKLVADITQTKPFLAVQSGVRNDELMLKIFGVTYDCLPKPVCRFVTEKQFVTFCMKHRAQLLGLPAAETGQPK
jgi:hypothetical protein